MDDLGDRMKAYEDAYRVYLPPRMPIMIRVDGRAFHSLLKRSEKPFDQGVMFSMDRVLHALIREAQGSVIGYVQSDEVSVVLQNDRDIQTQQWFGGNLQKIITAAATIATNEFNDTRSGGKTRSERGDKLATFDARAWIMPWEDVPNYFVWRQRDYIRNAVSMAARSIFSHKQLNNKNCADMLSMLMEKGIHFDNKYSLRERYGYFASSIEPLPNIGFVDYTIMSNLINKVRTYEPNYS